jgi:integrase
VAVNPTTGLEMPAVRGGRDRIAAPDECAALLVALAVPDRPIWATAMYAGLLRGELMALRVEDVDLATGVIHVCRGWDVLEGVILPKSGKERRVPIAGVLWLTSLNSCSLLAAQRGSCSASQRRARSRRRPCASGRRQPGRLKASRGSRCTSAGTRSRA